MGVRTSSILVDGWADQVLDWFSDRFELRRKRNQRLIHLILPPNSSSAGRGKRTGFSRGGSS